jgi:hypothetical protein
MTSNQLQDLEFVVNIDAAAAYRDSDLGAYLDGYGDGMNHTFQIGRKDKAYFDGYMKAVTDEIRQAEEAMVQVWTDNPNYADIHRQGLAKTLTGDMDRGFSLYYCGASRDVCTSDDMRLAWDAARTGNKVANIQRKR